MKFKNWLIFISLFTLSLRSFAQASPVDWSVSCVKQNASHYRIIVSGKINAGWHVYAAKDEVSQLTGVELSWDNEHIIRDSAMQNQNPEFIQDPVFAKKLPVYRNELVLSQPVEIRGLVPASFKIKINAFATNGNEFQPVEVVQDVVLEGGIAAVPTMQIKLSTIDLNNPKATCGDNEKKRSGNILALFFLGMAGGLIALLTPCVFPMIPVTVSFFTNRAKTKKEGIKNGILYGSCILGIYLLASLPFHLIGNLNPGILNSISTNSWVNLVFFFVFIFFALSFFGLFELSLPSNITTKTDSKSSLGSISGIFFMALTLAAVSFSCTGPILGSLLVGSISASGGAWQLTAGMAGFGLTLALPFGLFAMFPDWMKRLPKSGGWLDTVKKILAFVELALAFKFLSNADLVQHWGLLKREVFIGIWILIALGLTIYLFIKQKKILCTIALLFTIYLIPGLSRSEYSDLKLLSGFPPPHSYSVYGKQQDDKLKPDFINDYAKAVERSKQEHKPILIDFTGWACVNCRKMEEQVWTSPEITELIKNKFILVSLYVDDRKKLEDPFTYAAKDINTVGEQWATFQAENFGQVTQPLYVILDSKQELMNRPVGYTPDANTYKQWLECGLEAVNE